MVQCVGGRSGFWLFLAAVIWFLVNIDVIFLFFIGLFGGCFWNSGILVSLPSSANARPRQAPEEEHRRTARLGKFYPVDLSVFYNCIEVLYSSICILRS